MKTAQHQVADSAPKLSSSTFSVKLRCGTLRLQIERADMDLHELCGFASRRSRKRGFVFVSKVLGKHYPVRPRLMADIYARLAQKLAELSGPAVFIAMAETATGLGHGIYEAWLRHTGRDDVLFQHSTRYRLRRPLALEFSESHSHATRHFLYASAESKHAQLFAEAKTLVLVDDEISTGRTLANLALAYRRLNSAVVAVHVVCLTDWLGPDRRAALAEQIGLPIRFHNLLQGSFALEEDAQFDPGPIPDVTGGDDFKDDCLTRNHGRLGVRGPLSFDLDRLIRSSEIRPGERLLVLGTGEFAYPPYLLARRLEERGWDVHFQSTTRSPLLLDRDITSALEFVDNYHDGMPNYVYNVGDRRYERIIVGYETWPLPAAHLLPQRIGALPLFF
jgi:hypothetical protein